MLLNYLEKLHNLETLNDVWDHHVEAMAGFGFDRLIYGYSKFLTDHSEGLHDDIFVLARHDPEYLEPFIDQQMYRASPMMRWSRHHVGACSWSWMRQFRDCLTPDELKVVELNRRLDVTAGYTISFRTDARRGKAAIALTAERGRSQDEVDALWQRHGREILQMNNAMHFRVMCLPYRPSRPRLTDRQREVLEWIGEGKTVQDTAAILGLKRATVEKHLHLARKALNVETSTQAVLKAAIQSEIDVPRLTAATSGSDGVG